MRDDGGIELHFAVDKDVGAGETGKDGLEKVHGFVTTATTETRKREESDSWGSLEEFLGGKVGLVNDFGELFDGGVFTGGDIGEEKEIVVAGEDGEAGKCLVGCVARRFRGRLAIFGAPFELARGGRKKVG